MKRVIHIHPQDKQRTIYIGGTEITIGAGSPFYTQTIMIEDDYIIPDSDLPSYWEGISP
jgi:hypothetical protein